MWSKSTIGNRAKENVKLLKSSEILPHRKCDSCDSLNLYVVMFGFSFEIGIVFCVRSLCGGVGGTFQRCCRWFFISVGALLKCVYFIGKYPQT